MGKSDTLKNLERKRGRPSGKNRVPLSVEERRSRNAQYERERRTETADAMANLAQALGCKDTTSHANILVTAVQKLQRASSRDPSDDILELKRCNARLLQQIEDIEKRLTKWEDRVDEKSKKHGVIKTKDKIKKIKMTKPIDMETVQGPMETNTPLTGASVEGAEKNFISWEDPSKVRSKKKTDKIKIKKTTPTSVIAGTQGPIKGDLPSANEPLPPEASACEESQMLKTEPTEVDPFQMDSFVAEYPIMDWGIDDLVAEFL